MKRPLLPPMLALMAGIMLAEYVEVSLFPILVILAIVYLFILLTLKHHALITITLVWMSFFLLGFSHMRLITQPPRDENHIFYHLNGQMDTYEGVILDVSQRPDEGSLLTVALYRRYGPSSYRSTHGRVLLSVLTNQQFTYGDVIRFETRLKEPRSFKNPGTFNYAKYLRYRGIWARGTINRPSALCIIRSGYGTPFFKPFNTYREKLRDLIATQAPFPASSVIQACILGLQKGIPSDIMEKFNRTGTSHIIAISGFNMAIVAGFAALVTRFILSIYPPMLLRINLQIASVLTASLFVIFFTFLAGAGISVVRATITILVFMFALILGRVREADNTMALAAVLILLFSPYLLFDLSFQLSFSAVCSLIYLTPKLMALLPPREANNYFFQKLVSIFYGFFVTTLSATAGTLPILLFHFHRLSPLVLLSNLLVVPILGFLVIPLSMLIIIVTPLSTTLASLIISITAQLVNLAIYIVDFLSHLPYSSLLLPRVGLVQIVLYIALVAIFVSALGTKHRLSLKLGFGLLLTLLLLISVMLPIENNRPKYLEVTVLDVGQGQSVFLHLPTGEKVLIDGGGFFDTRFDVGKNVITPFLLYRGATHLSRIIISHPHPDHIGGLVYVVKNLSVGEIWVNKDTLQSHYAQSFMEEVKNRRIPVRVVSAGFCHKSEDGTKWEILHPPSNIDPSILKNENDRSIVLRLVYGQTSFLFPGDISETAERLLVWRHRSLSSNVLIVPHHGSRHSCSIDFIKTVKPLYACVSGGQDSRKLPHTDVIQRFQKERVPLYRTDLHGAVTFTSDGQKISIRTFSVAYEQ
ncbi:MAG: DNA internalization-related competence protein ComEC/Rec2 [Syntrophales bacterium]|nr:DNA internalization-related competence protein ComEC/Rec2 [Syntrophales bacterium]